MPQRRIHSQLLRVVTNPWYESRFAGTPDLHRYLGVKMARHRSGDLRQWGYAYTKRSRKKLRGEGRKVV